ncbi:hypothetical protein [Pedosphaera parvula]|uniref:Uncharacterized protein n=1 Tax=Pedosphaera parvula (strain Ellin514) TaxID=320771 RepID=B9XHM0_PEDPL|nr:hypothetical protein [Pedosphaera parvula]EEF60598.1 hypothetical protein Cflav_PD6188 [Pedosphaera parvula Ellin514]
MRNAFAACVVAIAMLASTVHAQTGVTWNPGGPDPGLWSNPANWGGTVPVSGYKAFINNSTVGPCIVDGVAGGCQITIANGGGPSTLIVTNGGDLTAGDTNGDIHNIGWTQIGGSGTGSMIIENGGNVKFMLHLWVGQDPGGVGTLIMNGGTASVTNHPDGNWQLGSGGTGYIYMNGGTLFLLKWDGTNQVNGASHIDIAGGTIIVNGDKTGIINSLKDAGKITAYGGSGTLNIDYNNINPGKTTISAQGIGVSGRKIKSIEVNGGNVTIKYETTSGGMYHLESSASLSPASWATVPGSTVTASGTEEIFSFPIPSNEPTFFRVASP